MRLLLARMRRMVGTDAVDDALRDAVPEAFSVGGVADRRIELRQRAEPLVAFGRREREMGRRRLRRGDILVVGEKHRLFLGRDVQHMHALAGFVREPRSAAACTSARRWRRARPDASADRPRRAGSCARAGDIRPRNETRRGGGSLLSTARTPSSSSISSEPVDEPMNTLTPATPGSISSSPRSLVFSRVAPT